MKITISKNQWQMIGKKAGWIKTSEVSENVVPVEQILGTTSTGTLDQIDQEMHSKGYFLFREHYPWGRTLSYQNKTGDKIYLERNDAEKMVWMNWEQLKEQMRKDWRPAGRADQDWYMTNLAP
jgi:hypothetical protein